VKINAPEKAMAVSVANVRHYTDDLTLFNALVLQRAVCAEHLQLEYNYTH
jgi:hypothetical protein